MNRCLWCLTQEDLESLFHLATRSEATTFEDFHESATIRSAYNEDLAFAEQAHYLDETELLHAIANAA